MANLVVSHDLFLFVCKNGIFLLITSYDHLYTLLQIRLGHIFPVLSYCPKSRFIYNVGKLCSGRSGCHPGDNAEVHALIHLNFPCMYLQDILPALQIRQLYRNPPVESSRPGKGRIQGLGAVGRRKDDHAVVCLKSIHLCQQLVQRLLPLVVAAYTSLTLLSDGIDLIDKYDTGSFFLRLSEQITDFGCSHTYEHFHEFRTGH